MNITQWPKKKIVWLFNTIGSGTTPLASNDIYYNSSDIAWLNTGDLTDSYVKKTSKYISKHALSDYSALSIYPKESLVIAMYGATIGKLGITEYETTTNQACCVLSNPKDILTKFAFYWLMAHRLEIINLSQGGGQPNISQGIIKNIRISLPPIDLQQKIINLIDYKFKEIGDVVEKKEKMINLLNQKRQSIISEVVTRGLNPNIKMKKSDVSWIGEVPEHWNITKIKYNTYVKGRIGWQGLKSDEFVDEGPYLITGTDFKNGNIDWSTCYHVSEERYDEAPPIHLNNDDLLITKDGTIGKLAIVKDMPYKAILNSGIFVVRPLNNQYFSKYMYWLLSSNMFYEYIKLMETGSTIKHLYQETFINFVHPLPLLNEQEEIVDYLDNKIHKIDNIILNIKRQLVMLKEYRQTLIYEAVTGKVDLSEINLN